MASTHPTLAEHRAHTPGHKRRVARRPESAANTPEEKQNECRHLWRCNHFSGGPEPLVAPSFCVFVFRFPAGLWRVHSPTNHHRWDCSATLQTYRDKKKIKEGGTRKGAREQALAPEELSHTAVTGRQLGRPAPLHTTQ